MTALLPRYQRLNPPDTCQEWRIPIEIVTPLFGGGYRTRLVDKQTPVRSSSIRGQLRFWWRALYGGNYITAKALYNRERELFGGLSGEAKKVAASRVDVEVRDLVESVVLVENVPMDDPASYALWPARATSRGDPPAERWAPGMRFSLVIRLTNIRGSATDDRRELTHTLRAWLLFGGIGGRTRRGCGAVGISDETTRKEWLPESFNVGAVSAWLSAGPAATQGYPSLTGSSLCFGRASSAMNSWYESIGWLRDFRQGANRYRTDTSIGGIFARQCSSLARGSAGRPGRSRWPEPDLIRFEYQAFDHSPLIPARPISWPRAQFGLPIQFRFQNKDRRGGYLPNRPPPPGELGWSPTGQSHEPSRRLASPLIVKPAQLRDGRFASIAVWLNRALPPDATVGVRDRSGLRSTARMSVMPSSPALFTPLSNKASTRDAFMDWLHTAFRLNGGFL